MNEKDGPSRVVTCLLLATLAVVGATNPPSAVLELNEKFLNVKNDGFWFVEFYAPWCAHCKRLHPTWDQVGYAISDKSLPIRVAKLDCTRFPSVASELSINGFPTIAFFRNGRRIDYHGNREKDAMLNFAIKCAAPIVEPIQWSQLEAKKLESRSDPSFILYDDPSSELYKKFSEIADSMFSGSRFYSISKDSIAKKDTSNEYRVSVLKDNVENWFEGQLDDLEGWIKRERWASFAMASASNLAELGSSGKLVVLIVSSKIERFNESSPVGRFHEMSTEAVTELRKKPNLWKRYQFAWLDGSDLASSIQMYMVAEPSLFVFNYTTYEYYVSEDDPMKMTSKSVITFLGELADALDKNTATAYGGRAILTRIRRMMFEVYWNVAQMFATQPLLSSCLFGVPIAFLSIICYSICSADFTVERDEFFPENEDEEDGEDDDEEEGDDLAEERLSSDADDDHEKAE